MTNKEQGEQLLEEARASNLPTNGKPNTAEAVELYKQAAEPNNTNAMINLDFLEQSGDLGNSDIEEAKESYEKVADLKNTNAMINLDFLDQSGDLGISDI